VTKLALQPSCPVMRLKVTPLIATHVAALWEQTRSRTRIHLHTLRRFGRLSWPVEFEESVNHIPKYHAIFRMTKPHCSRKVYRALRDADLHATHLCCLREQGRAQETRTTCAKLVDQ
jgi:hypothetical protein